MLRIRNKKNGSISEVTEEKWEELKKLGWGNYWAVEKIKPEVLIKQAKKNERERPVVLRIDEGISKD